jgi:hypothetical protein
MPEDTTVIQKLEILRLSQQKNTLPKEIYL